MAVLFGLFGGWTHVHDHGSSVPTIQAEYKRDCVKKLFAGIFRRKGEEINFRLTELIVLDEGG